MQIQYKTPICVRLWCDQLSKRRTLLLLLILRSMIPSASHLDGEGDLNSLWFERIIANAPSNPACPRSRSSRLKTSQDIHAIISAGSCDRPSPVEDPPRVSYERVTLASGGFQSRTIEDGDDVSPMLDQIVHG